MMLCAASRRLCLLFALTFFVSRPTALFAAPPLQGSPDEILTAIDTAVKNRTRSKDLLVQLGQQLRSPDSSIQVKERAAWALGELEATSQVPVLLEAAKSKGLIIRSAALGALIHLRSRESLPALVQIAQSDPILSMRQQATIGLGLISTDSAIKPLVALSSDQTIEVRGAAALAMATHQSERNNFSEALKQMTAEDSSYVADRARIGLNMIARKSQTMRLSLESDDSDIRLFAGLYFQNYGSSADLHALTDAANVEADDDVQRQMNLSISAIKKRAEAARQREEQRKKAEAAKAAGGNSQKP